MGYPQVFVTIVISLLLALPHGFANEAAAPTDAFAIDLLYYRFESRYTPEELLQKFEANAIVA